MEKLVTHVIEVEVVIHFSECTSYNNEEIEFKLETNINIYNYFELFYVSIEIWKENLILKLIVQDGIYDTLLLKFERERYGYQ